MKAQALAKRSSCLHENIFSIEGSEDDLALIRPGYTFCQNSSLFCCYFFSLIVFFFKKKTNQKQRKRVSRDNEYRNDVLLNCCRRVKSMSCSESLLARGIVKEVRLGFWCHSYSAWCYCLPRKLPFFFMLYRAASSVPERVPHPVSALFLKSSFSDRKNWTKTSQYKTSSCGRDRDQSLPLFALLYSVLSQSLTSGKDQ